jgi:hypothetical protein
LPSHRVDEMACYSASIKRLDGRLIYSGERRLLGQASVSTA